MVDSESYKGYDSKANRADLDFFNIRMTSCLALVGSVFVCLFGLIVISFPIILSTLVAVLPFL